MMKNKGKPEYPYHEAILKNGGIAQLDGCLKYMLLLRSLLVFDTREIFSFQPKIERKTKKNGFKKQTNTVCM